MTRLPRTLRLAVAAVFLAMTATACASDEPADAAPASAASPTADAAQILADMGVPPTPAPAAWKAYIAALKKIDPAIVGDDEEKVVDRGRDQCGSVKEFPNDTARLVDLTNKRFTAPGHSDGFGKAKAEKILAAVRQYICPTY